MFQIFILFINATDVYQVQTARYGLRESNALELSMDTSPFKRRRLEGQASQIPTPVQQVHPSKIIVDEDTDSESSYKQAFQLRWVVRKDQDALKAFEESARKGNIKAMRELADMSLNGIGTENGSPDIDTAFLCYSALIELSEDSNAQNNLGLMFWQGVLPKDEQEKYFTHKARLEKAKELFDLSSKNGSKLAQKNSEEVMLALAQVT